MQKTLSTTSNLFDTPPAGDKLEFSLVERMLLLPPNPAREAEGGLRTLGKFKRSLPGKPLVSILIAVYNGERFFEQTILSILEQDYDNIELIIIDGGSKDRTIDVVRKYEYAINYWVSEPDSGISDAFNKAVMLSSGDYLNFQGASDLLAGTNVVKQMLEGADPNKDMLISARVKRVREYDSDEVVWVAPRKYSKRFYKHSLLFRMSLPHQGLLTNVYMFEKYGLFDTNNKYSMDYEHLLRAYRDFPNVVMKDIVFSAWREGGVGVGNTLEILEEYSEIKLKNMIAPVYILQLIRLWSYLKLEIKSRFGSCI